MSTICLHFIYITKANNILSGTKETFISEVMKGGKTRLYSDSPHSNIFEFGSDSQVMYIIN